MQPNERKTGRILRSLSGFYDVQTTDGVITCRGRGHLRRGDETPLTGDMVESTVERGKGMVERIWPRKNCLVRPAVANVDALVKRYKLVEEVFRVQILAVDERREAKIAQERADRAERQAKMEAAAAASLAAMTQE